MQLVEAQSMGYYEAVPGPCPEFVEQTIVPGGISCAVSDCSCFLQVYVA